MDRMNAGRTIICVWDCLYIMYSFVLLERKCHEIICGFLGHVENWCLISATLTHCCLEMPYGDIELGQYWLRWWLAAWRHQAIIWTNVKLSSVRSSDNHLRTVLQETLQPSVTSISLKIIYLKYHLNLPGVSELFIDCQCNLRTKTCITL